MNLPRVSDQADFHQATGAKNPGFHDKSPPLRVGETKPLPFELILQNTVLFYEIVNDRLLVTVKPARAVTRRWKCCMTLVIAGTDYP